MHHTGERPTCRPAGDSPRLTVPARARNTLSCRPATPIEWEARIVPPHQWDEPKSRRRAPLRSEREGEGAKEKHVVLRLHSSMRSPFPDASGTMGISPSPYRRTPIILHPYARFHHTFYRFHELMILWKKMVVCWLVRAQNICVALANCLASREARTVNLLSIALMDLSDSGIICAVYGTVIRWNTLSLLCSSSFAFRWSWRCVVALYHVSSPQDLIFFFDPSWHSSGFSSLIG